MTVNDFFSFHYFSAWLEEQRMNGSGSLILIFLFVGLEKGKNERAPTQMQSCFCGQCKRNTYHSPQRADTASSLLDAITGSISPIPYQQPWNLQKSRREKVRKNPTMFFEIRLCATWDTQTRWENLFGINFHRWSRPLMY